jgi:hypothetical protein
MRIVHLISSLALAACTVGDPSINVNDDDGMGSGSGSGVAFTACVDRAATIAPAYAHSDDKTSHAGRNCIVGGCHLNNMLGTGAPGYQFAGTVYATGTTNPQAGAAVRIKAGDKIETRFTDTDGNFYFEAGLFQGTFTANTNASACPGPVATMVTPLMGGGGGGAGANSCNLCHTTAAGAQAAPITM